MVCSIYFHVRIVYSEFVDLLLEILLFAKCIFVVVLLEMFIQPRGIPNQIVKAKQVSGNIRA